MKCCPYVVPFLLKKPLSVDFRGFQLRIGDPAGTLTFLFCFILFLFKYIDCQYYNKIESKDKVKEIRID